MNSSGTLFQEYPAQIKAVRDYLRVTLPDADLAESEDFDRDGIRFRLEPRRLIFISHEFLSDFTTQDAASRLRAWRVAEQAKSLSLGSMLLVTTDGTFVENTQNNSLST